MERLVADLFFPMTQRKSISNRLGVRAMKPGSSLKTILRWYRVFRMRTLFECLWATIRWKNWPYQFLVKNSNSMKSSSQEVFPGFDLAGHQKVYMKHDDFAWFPPVPSTTSTWNSIFHGLRQSLWWWKHEHISLVLPPISGVPPQLSIRCGCCAHTYFSSGVRRLC